MIGSGQKEFFFSCESEKCCVCPLCTRKREKEKRASHFLILFRGNEHGLGAVRESGARVLFKPDLAMMARRPSEPANRQQKSRSTEKGIMLAAHTSCERDGQHTKTPSKEDPVVVVVALSCRRRPPESTSRKFLLFSTSTSTVRY